MQRGASRAIRLCRAVDPACRDGCVVGRPGGGSRGAGAACRPDGVGDGRRVGLGVDGNVTAADGEALEPWTGSVVVVPAPPHAVSTTAETRITVLNVINGARRRPGAVSGAATRSLSCDTLAQKPSIMVMGEARSPCISPRRGPFLNINVGTCSVASLPHHDTDDGPFRLRIARTMPLLSWLTPGQFGKRAIVVNQRIVGNAERQRLDLTDEDRVVATIVASPWPALDPGQAAVDEW